MILVFLIGSTSGEALLAKTGLVFGLFSFPNNYSERALHQNLFPDSDIMATILSIVVHVSGLPSYPSSLPGGLLCHPGGVGEGQIVVIVLPVNIRIETPLMQASKLHVSMDLRQFISVLSLLPSLLRRSRGDRLYHWQSDLNRRIHGRYRRFCRFYHRRERIMGTRKRLSFHKRSCLDGRYC